MPCLFDEFAAKEIGGATSDDSIASAMLIFCASSFIEENPTMSHFSTLRSKLTDAEMLKAALRDLGMTFKTNANVRGLCNESVPADIVLVLDGDCDLGWSRSADGSFAIVADLWGLAKHYNLEKLLGSINQKYAVNQTLSSVKRPGLQNANVKLMVQD